MKSCFPIVVMLESIKRSSFSKASVIPEGEHTCLGKLHVSQMTINFNKNNLK